MDWSYVAGFFDGECNFHIVFTKRSIQLVCRMYGDNLETLKKIKQFIGFGNIYNDKKGIKVSELTITKKDHVKAFIEGILHHLITKRDHAEFILSNYNFGRNNNLDFDRKAFHSFIKRKGASKFHSKSRDAEIKERKNYLDCSPNI
ncbi:MAG: LAGLIDADG family homing endonuclease [Nanoarchaeota archaeon]|nr:LAGLIDADG family homing endonuclease [Nanoarchaeota archaeon]